MTTQNVARDVAVDLREDRPGILAQATEALAKANINIDGYAEIEGILHVLTKDPRGAWRALERAGFRVRSEQEVLVIDAEDRAGVVAGIFRRIADAGVNVNFTYIAAGNRIVIATNDLQKAREALSR